VPASCIQNTLFGNNDTSKKKKLMKAVDNINKATGVKDTVRMAVQGFSKPFAMRCDHLSKRFTTNINELKLIQ
jgi:DNA polymerase V